jgi:hypothetical protein
MIICYESTYNETATKFGLTSQYTNNQTWDNYQLYPQWLFKVEGFRNIFSDLVVADSFARNPYALNNEPRDILQKTDFVTRNIYTDKALNYSNRGDGFSEGVEIFLKKSNKPGENGFFGWISYSNSITKRNNHQTRLSSSEATNRTLKNGSRKLLYQTEVGDNYVNYYDDNQFELLYDNDRRELYDLDRTHLLNIVFGWKITSEWQFGGRFRYFTNTPITPIVGSDRISQAASFGVNLNTPVYSNDFNSARLGSFQQVDLRLDRFMNYEWGLVNGYIEVINLLGRRNISGLEWLDRSVLKRKIEKAIATSGIEKITFNFWVPTKEREDQKKWGEIKKYQGDLPMGMVGYSQIRPFWGTGEKRSRGKLHLRPLSMFVGTWMREEDRLIYERKGIDIESAIGRKMYNIPEVFQTNKRVATEIFINEIIHDMFHFNLPMIALKKELLHKAVTDYCLFDKGQLPEKDPWDQFVLDAMTNPYFFLQSSETYPVPKNSVQAAFIKKNAWLVQFSQKTKKTFSIVGLRKSN